MQSLKKLNLSNFNFQNVNDMSYMFFGCESLINIEMPKLKNKNKINTENIFDGCKSLAHQPDIINN